MIQHKTMPIPEIIDRVTAIARKYNVKRLDLFGSFAYGNASERSDNKKKEKDKDNSEINKAKESQTEETSTDEGKEKKSFNSIDPDICTDSHGV